MFYDGSIAFHLFITETGCFDGIEGLEGVGKYFGRESGCENNISFLDIFLVISHEL